MRKKEGDKFSLILDAAVRVFCQVGFDKAQVATVAKEGGVATGSIYLYFRSKEDILDHVFSRYWADLLDKFQALPVQASEESIRAQLGLFFDSLANYPELGLLYLKEHHRFLERKPEAGFKAYEECVNMGIRAFVDGAKAGVFPEGIDIPFSRAFLFGGVHAALTYLFTSPELNHQILRERMLQMALASLSLMKGV